MKNLIIVTVGTSIIDNYINTPGERSFYQHSIINKDRSEKLDTLSNDFYSKIKQTILQSYEKDIANCPSESTLSAEIASLYVMAKKKIIHPQTDVVALLASDTLEGQIASAMNRDILTEKAGFKTVQIRFLNNINGRDAVAFTKAVNELQIADRMKEVINASNCDNTLFCFSGGYKGLIPIISQFAREKRIDMYYLYEHSDDLIKYHYVLEGGVDAMRISST